MRKEAENLGCAVVLGLVQARHHDLVVDRPDLAMAYVVQQGHRSGPNGLSTDDRRCPYRSGPVRLASFLHAITCAARTPNGWPICWARLITRCVIMRS